LAEATDLPVLRDSAFPSPTEAGRPLARCGEIGRPSADSRSPRPGGIAAARIQIVGPRRYSCSRLMSPNQTQPTDAFDTAELEPPAPAEPPAAEVQPGRPSWEPEDGDFS